MLERKLFSIFILFLLSITVKSEKQKNCIENLVINGTNLLAAYRKQLLVLGITNFQNQSSRIQANRFNDLYRELHRHDIRDSVVRLILINEISGARYLTENSYDKVKIYQDNTKDHLVKKLRNDGQKSNNLVFGRCGYLIFSQEQSHSNLEDGKNYNELVRVITTAVKNKRRCQKLCT